MKRGTGQETEAGGSLSTVFLFYKAQLKHYPTHTHLHPHILPQIKNGLFFLTC